MKKITKTLKLLNDVARDLGLDDVTLHQAEEFVEYNEFELSFDTLITQLYEYDIEINEDIYSLIQVIAEQLKLPDKNYSYMRDLVRKDGEIPIAVKKELSKIIHSL